MAGQRLRPLHGVPISIKDNLWTAGERSTYGSRLMRSSSKRNAVKRAEPLAGHDGPLRRARLAESSFGVNKNVSPQARVQPLDALQHGTRHLDRREHPTADQLRELHGGGEADIGSVHVSASPRGARPRAVGP